MRGGGAAKGGRLNLGQGLRKSVNANSDAIASEAGDRDAPGAGIASGLAGTNDALARQLRFIRSGNREGNQFNRFMGGLMGGGLFGNGGNLLQSLLLMKLLSGSGGSSSSSSSSGSSSSGSSSSGSSSSGRSYSSSGSSGYSPGPYTPGSAPSTVTDNGGGIASPLDWTNAPLMTPSARYADSEEKQWQKYQDALSKGVDPNDALNASDITVNGQRYIRQQLAQAYAQSPAGTASPQGSQDANTMLGGGTGDVAGVSAAAPAPAASTPAPTDSSTPDALQRALMGDTTTQGDEQKKQQGLT